MLVLMMLSALFVVLVIMFLIQYRLFNKSRNIKVIYNNNTSGKIIRNRLEELLVSGGISKFLRSSGWVTISDDPIRQTDNGHIIERRNSQLYDY